MALLVHAMHQLHQLHYWGTVRTVTDPCLPECGVARFLTLLNGPWATLIVRELLKGPHRFNQLREALPGISPHTLTSRLPGISPHTLTSRLRQFERHGIVTRTTYAEIPPRVEYALTPLGEGLSDVLEAMATWATAVPDPATDAGVTA
jgi:DNA-binding HxlR family transcriptional regulator